MEILLTNDDGILAPGIQALQKTLSQNFRVTLIAPKDERSATGHAITVHHPLRAFKKGEGEWAVDGTPADCVKLGIHCLMKKPPDLVISGINQGANLGTDVFYSGTVSAAMEGIIMGYPALAFSQVGNQQDFSWGARFARDYISYLEEEGLLSPSLLLNINFPACSREDIQGTAYTRLGRTEYRDIFHERRDPKDRPYFWMGGQVVRRDNEVNTDVAKAEKNFISITPLQLDLTDHALLKKIQNKNGSPRA